MSNLKILIDTGPIVALLNESENHHQACLKTASSIHEELWTTWPVITESAYLLRKKILAVRKLLELVQQQRLRVFEFSLTDIAKIVEILDIYSDQGLDLADASLMHMANVHGISQIFTLDRRHFSLYCQTAGRSVTLLPEMI